MKHLCLIRNASSTDAATILGYPGDYKAGNGGCARLEDFTYKSWNWVAMKANLYTPLLVAAASSKITFTSVPLPDAMSWEAEPRLVAISKYPMLPGIAKTSPGAPSA